LQLVAHPPIWEPQGRLTSFKNRESRKSLLDSSWNVRAGDIYKTTRKQCPYAYEFNIIEAVVLQLLCKQPSITGLHKRSQLSHLSRSMFTSKARIISGGSVARSHCHPLSISISPLSLRSALEHLSYVRLNEFLFQSEPINIYACRVKTPKYPRAFAYHSFLGLQLFSAIKPPRPNKDKV